MGVLSIVQSLKLHDQDYEFYPTSPEMLEFIRIHLVRDFNKRRGGTLETPHCSVLDVGAGNGSALSALTEGKRYAIEKSQILIEAMPNNVVILGTDFDKNTLIDKRVDVTFCNPPFLHYESWSVKVINEANCAYVYLVIPQRWTNNEAINTAIKEREAKAEVIWSGDFKDAERAARARVDIVKVTLADTSGWKWNNDKTPSPIVDPFALWFRNHFNVKLNLSEPSYREATERYNKRQQEKEQQAQEQKALIQSQGLIPTLEDNYNRRMQKLIASYSNVCSIDADIFNELGIELNSVKEGLESKIKGAKNYYWRELFGHFDAITSKLTSKTRQKFLDELFSQSHIDFDAANVHAVLCWVMKNANQYYDDQLIYLVDSMCERANVSAYKSNQKMFSEAKWRAAQTPEHLTHYKLEHRIILSCSSSTSTTFLDDILTVAHNLGFDTSNSVRPSEHEWQRGEKTYFYYRNHEKQEDIALFEAKAFDNGNVHLKWNQFFLNRLNVEHGRLKGWLNSAKNASEELNIPLDEVSASFGNNLQLTTKQMPQLLGCSLL